MTFSFINSIFLPVINLPYLIKLLQLKLQNKILLISITIAVLVVLSLAFATDSWPGNGFFLMAGVTGMFGGAGYVFLGLLLLFLKDKGYAKGLISGGIIIFLTGLILFKFLPQY